MLGPQCYIPGIVTPNVPIASIVVSSVAVAGIILSRISLSGISLACINSRKCFSLRYFFNNPDSIGYTHVWTFFDLVDCLYFSTTTALVVIVFEDI